MSTRTCGRCGARNASGADWCTQCFTPFASAAPDPREEGEGTKRADEHTPVAPPEGVASPGARAPTDAGQTAGTPRIASGGGRPSAPAQRDIRQTSDGDIEWRCATCEGWNPLSSPACLACGAARRGFGPEPEEPVDLPDEDRLVAYSILLPGLGHLRAGRVGSGLARALFGVGWLIGGLLLLLAATRAGAAHLAAVPLFAGAAAVWVLTVLDVRSLARGEHTERLDGRTLLWLMAGVTGALVSVLMLDTWRLAG